MAAAPRGETILIVDDFADVRRTHRLLFESKGFTVEEAESGDEALACLERKLPSVVLLDVMMPGMDGLQVLQTIRSDNAMKNVPVILVTARAAKEDIDAAFRSAADLYITKPCPLPKLLQAVEDVLARRVK